MPQPVLANICSPRSAFGFVRYIAVTRFGNIPKIGSEKRHESQNFLCDKIDTLRMVPGSQSPHEITTLLAAWREGDEEALNRLIAVVYPEMRRGARQHFRRRGPRPTRRSPDPGHAAY